MRNADETHRNVYFLKARAIVLLPLHYDHIAIIRSIHKALYIILSYVKLIIIIIIINPYLRYQLHTMFYVVNKWWSGDPTPTGKSTDIILSNSLSDITLSQICLSCNKGRYEMKRICTLRLYWLGDNLNMKWILLWIMPLVQDRSPVDLLTSSPARYLGATDNPCKEERNISDFFSTF